MKSFQYLSILFLATAWQAVAQTCSPALMKQAPSDAFERVLYQSNQSSSLPLYGLKPGHWLNVFQDSALMFADLPEGGTRAIVAHLGDDQQWQFLNFPIYIGEKYKARMADMDGDGHQDLVTVHRQTTFEDGQWYQKVRLITFHKLNVEKPGFLHRDVSDYTFTHMVGTDFNILSDVDGDSIADMVFVHRNGTGRVWVTVFPGSVTMEPGRVTPRIGFEAPIMFETVIDEWYLGGKLASGDFDGDGKQELVLTRSQRSSNNPLSLRVRHLTLFVEPDHPNAYLDNGVIYALDMAAFYRNIDTRYDPHHVADIDGDGRDNLIFSGYGESTWFTISNLEMTCEGDGWTAAYDQKYDTPNLTDRHPKVGELNGDGRAEMMYAAHNLTGPYTPEGMYMRTQWYEDGAWQENDYVDLDLATDTYTYFFAMDLDGEGGSDYVFFDQLLSDEDGVLRPGSIRAYLHQ